MMSVSTGDSLLRQCVLTLDAIYSSFDCSKFNKTLELIEHKLFDKQFSDLESFQQELVTIPAITTEFIESINLNINDKVPEEYCTTPIYSSFHVHEQSMMYSVNIDTYRELHSSLYNDMIQPSNLRTHRLFLIRNGYFLLNARDHIHNFVALFFNVETKTCTYNPAISYITADVAIVHPLGEIHTTVMEEFEGWIKVKIAQTKKLNSIIPTSLAERLFTRKEQIPRKTPIKLINQVSDAKEYELEQQFLTNITGSPIKKLQTYFDLKTDNLLTSSSSNQYTNVNNTSNQSLIPAETGNHVNKPIIKIKPIVNNVDTELAGPSTLQETTTTTTTTTTTATTATSSTNMMETNTKLPVFHKHWRKLVLLSQEKNVPIVPMTKYSTYIKQNSDAEGYFKQVYFAPDKVIQVFQRSTASQIVLEISSLLQLKGRDNIGCIDELLYDEAGTKIIGLTMKRYNKTLKEYLKLHSRHRLTSQQRMHIIIQMLKSMRESHQIGIAHRDLSSVNFMIDFKSMDDLPELYLIDFGKAVFYDPKVARKWWVNSDDGLDLYEDDVKPNSKEELAIWCKNLPYCMAKPDHGYRFYRSIQTLPRTNKDHELLPHLIDPAAEDIYSLGNIVWKTFLDIEPWPGIFDTDLKLLRQTVGNDANIDDILEKSMPGPVSIEFLKMFLRAKAEDRKTADEILMWLENPEVQESLMQEWNGPRKGARKSTRTQQKKEEKTVAMKKPSARGEIPAMKSAKLKVPLALDTDERVSAKKPLKNEVAPTATKGKRRLREDDLAEEEVALPTSKKRNIEGVLCSDPRYCIKDGVKCYTKSGIPTGRPASRMRRPVLAKDKEKGAKVKPARVKPARVKPAEVKPAEVKPVEEKPVEEKPAAVMTRKRRRSSVVVKEVKSVVVEVADEEEPVARTPKKPCNSYVKTGKPRGRPKKISRSRPEAQVLIGSKMPAEEESNVDFSLPRDQPIGTVVSSDTKLTTPSSSPKFIPASSTSPKFLPSLSPPFTASTHHVTRSRRSSQSTCLSTSPRSTRSVAYVETMEPSTSELVPALNNKGKRSFSEVEMNVEPSTDEKKKKKKQRVASTDDFDRQLYDILQNLVEDKS